MSNGTSGTQLHQQAETQLHNQPSQQVDLSLQDARQLIHALQVRQSELEAQNAALQTMQKQIENVQHKYWDLCESSAIGLLVVDTEGYILETNLTLTELLEVEPNNLMGSRFSDFVTPLSQNAYLFFLQRLHHSGEPQECEIDLIQNNRGSIVARLKGRAIIQSGKTTLYNVAVSKIVAEKQTEMDTRERQQMTILANFVGNMSHDLRTPLTQIATGLYLVGRISDPELRLKKVSKIEAHLFSLAHILEQLQTMAVLDSLVKLARHPAAINSLLHDVMTSTKTSMEAKGIGLSTTFQENLPLVPMNADYLSLALLNLLKNAIQFTPAGGLISLTASRQDQDVMIEVSDTGIGIPANALPHIFERFFKADTARSNQTGGAGLGLSLVKRVVELHHGTLEVSSTPGVKTVFRIRLPLNQP